MQLTAAYRLSVALASTMLATSASAASLTTLYTFTGGIDGMNPNSGLAPGPRGSLLGTSGFGGAAGLGTAFQLIPPSERGDAWSFSLVHSFTGGADGGLPDRLLADGTGNLFGEAIFGGAGPCQTGPYQGCGLVFELSPPKAGQTAWTETVLYDFQGGADGFYPQDGLVRSAEGDLYGTTLQAGGCGLNGCGTAFKLTPPAHGETQWTKTTLWTFTSKSAGHDPFLTLLPDRSGRLFGVALDGGYSGNEACKQFGCGAVYMLTPPPDAAGVRKEKPIWRFSGEDGISPFTNLSFDADGNLYGLTNHGGDADYCTSSDGCGTLYKLTPPADGRGEWSLSLPWIFTGGTDGAFPDGAGLMPFFENYVTTTSGDEASTFGSIDLFRPSKGAAAWHEDTLFTFTNDADGENPSSPLLERDGTYYGETAGSSGSGGPAAFGTIYSFRP